MPELHALNELAAECDGFGDDALAEIKNKRCVLGPADATP